MAQLWMDEFQGSQWKGIAELWIDPAGNEVNISDCTLTIESDTLAYTWAYEGETKTGTFTFYNDNATWIDSWHQSTLVNCRYLTEAWGLFTVEYSYAAPSEPAWGWRSKLSQRPDGSLVLQMTNIAPWGEEGRAVRMVLHRESPKAD